jgi:hypothetical protein
MSIRDRLGFDAGGMDLEEALAWAARYDFHYVDFNADQPPNALDAWDEARVRMAFGALDDKLIGRDYLAACWHEA